MTEPPTLTTNLDGQHAIVTGAAAGIGRAVARALHAAGANVTVTDIDGGGARAVADSLSAAGPRAWACGWTSPTTPRCAPASRKRRSAGAGWTSW